MTVIAWDGTTLAADRQNNYGNMARSATKLRLLRGHLCAFSGPVPLAMMMFEWFARGALVEEFPVPQQDRNDFGALLVISPDGGPILEWTYGAYPESLEDPYIAIGSGRDFALAAMVLGKTAPEAVEVASLLDVTCGHGVDILTFAHEKPVPWVPQREEGLSTYNARHKPINLDEWLFRQRNVS